MKYVLYVVLAVVAILVILLLAAGSRSLYALRSSFNSLNIYYSNIIIQVPADSYEAYKTSPDWQQLSNRLQAANL